MLKLNLGSFTVMFKDWMNVDLVNDPLIYSYAGKNGYQYYSMDLRGGIPSQDNFVDYIHCSHMVEHLTFREAEAFMGECYRVLKPGGVARFAVPDTSILCNMYDEGRLLELDEINEPSKKSAKYHTERFWNVMFEGHHSLWDELSFTELCQGAGFTNIQVREYQQGHPVFMAECKDLFPEISLYMEVVK